MEKFNHHDLHDALQGLNLRSKQVEYVKGFMMGQNVGGLSKSDFRRSLKQFKTDRHDGISHSQAERIHTALTGMVEGEPEAHDSHHDDEPPHESQHPAPPADENLTKRRLLPF